MFEQQLATAIEAARPSQLNEIAATLWKGHAAGLLTDDDAQRLAEVIEARRALSRAPGGSGSAMARPAGRSTMFRPRRIQHARKHPERIARRRKLAASGPMPPQLAAGFTVSELAVLRIVADEVRAKGFCDRSLAELAARAGTCRSLAQAVLRRADALGLLTIEERRRPGAPHLPNLIRVTCPTWRAWIMRGPKGGRVQKNEPHGQKINSRWQMPRPFRPFESSRGGDRGPG